MSEYGWITTTDGRRIYRKLDRGYEPQRSHLSRPYIRADGMDAVVCPVDGKPYESRSEYYAAVKAAGCEIVGDDKGHWDRPAPEYKPEGVKQDLVENWRKLAG